MRTASRSGKSATPGPLNNAHHGKGRDLNWCWEDPRRDGARSLKHTLANTSLSSPVHWSVIWASLPFYCLKSSHVHNPSSSFCRVKQNLHSSEQQRPMAASEFLNSASFTIPVPQLTTSTLPPYATGTSDQRFMTDTDKVFFNAVLATNSISVAACLLVIIAYFFLRRKYPQVLSRTSLKLSIAMACSDTIYHV